MMKKIFLFFFIIIFSSSVFSQSPNWIWAKGIGGTGEDRKACLVVDASGNVYTTSYFTGTVDFDPGVGVFNLTSSGVDDICLSKLDGSGNFLWAKRIGGADVDRGYSLVAGALGAIYITGVFSTTVDFDPGPGTFNLISNGWQDIFIIKFDSSGNFVWAKGIGSSASDVGSSIKIDLNGNVYTAGHFFGTADFDPGAGIFNLTSNGATDIFISKLDNSGNFVWTKQIGGSSQYTESPYSVAIDFTGNGVYTTGNFYGTVDFDPGAGVFNLTAVGGIFISKLDSMGNFRWAKAIDETGHVYYASMAIDAIGNIYITGYFDGTVDFDPDTGIFNLTSAGYADIFISKLDSSGNFLWAKAMGGPSGDVAYSIAVDSSSNVYVTGVFNETVDFDPGAGTFNLTSSDGIGDIFITKLNSSGNFVWAKAVSGINNDVGFSLALNASANLCLAGYFKSSSLSFGSDTLTNADSGGNTYDRFIAMLDTALVMGTTELENPDNGVLVFPNPAVNQLQIQNSEFRIKEVEIYNVFGEKVCSLQQTTNIKRQTVDVSQLPSGIYFVKLFTENGTIATKFVKQ